MTVPLHGVIPAAGIGSRMGEDTPKQYRTVHGMTLLEYSVQALLQTPGMQSVTIALHPDDAMARTLDQLNDDRVQCVTGGAERSDSVLAALCAVPGEAEDWVLVHDAARPCLQVADVQRLVEVAIARDEGGILAEPVMDTVKVADAAGRVEKTLDRSRLWRAQTPQMFRLGELMRALEAARAQDLPVTDEASAMELMGHAVNLVQGPASNLKVTVPQDLELVAWYLWREGEKG